MSGLWSQISALEDRLKRVAKIIQNIAEPSAAMGRETLAIVQQEVEVDSYNLTDQQATFVNGDRDTIVVQRLGVAVSRASSPSAEPYIRAPLQKTPEGWHRRDLDASVLDSEFDFLWNYTVQSRQSSYSRDFVSSDALVGFDKGMMLDLRTPLVLPPNESVTFFVRPLMFAIPQNSTPVVVGSSVYYVSFVGLGYRRPA